MERYCSCYCAGSEWLTKCDQMGNLTSSLCEDGGHAPVIDIDFRVQIYAVNPAPSRCIVVNFLKEIKKDDYLEILEIMVECGIVKKALLKKSRRELRNENVLDFVLIHFSVPIRLVPSSTEMHFHLYIDSKIKTWQLYKKLLAAMHKAEIIDEKFFKLCDAHKKSFVLKEGCKKPIQVIDHGDC